MNQVDEPELPPGASARDRQRADRWLWAARFFKTRSLARQALDTGRVEVNGNRAKPARLIGAGDRLCIRCPAGAFEVEVRAVNEQRRPATEARELYREFPDSIERRQREAAALRLERAAVVHDGHRPDRRTRRATIRFRRTGGDSDDG